MLETVEALSKTEDRGADAVLRDLLLVDVDLVRVRLTDAEDDGSISVSAGAAMIGASRGMLIAAACSTVRPQRFSGLVGIRRLKTILTRCVLGKLIKAVS